MKQITNFITKHLSTILFTLLYLVLFLLFIALESFEPETQSGLLLIMGTCIVYGFCLDYVVGKNTILPKNYKIFTQILPLGFFVIYALTFMFDLIGKATPELFYFLIYIFIILPFAVACYNQTSNNKKLIFSIIGTACVFAEYLHLTTISKELNTTTGLTVYIIVFLIAFYAANSIHRIPFLSVILGIGDGFILYWLSKNPITDNGKLFGWDYDFMKHFEYLLMINLAVSIIITVISAIVNPVQQPIENPKRKRL